MFKAIILSLKEKSYQFIYSKFEEYHLLSFKRRGISFVKKWVFRILEFYIFWFKSFDNFHILQIGYIYIYIKLIFILFLNDVKYAKRIK